MKSIIAIAKQISGGTQSQVGKKVGTKYLIKLFESLGISANSKDDFFYELNKTPNTYEVDGLLYFKHKLIKQIEIKLLGIGNPEMGDQAISRQSDILIIDQLTKKMEMEATNKGIEVIFIKNAPQKLYEYLKKKGLAVKPPKSV